MNIIKKHTKGFTLIEVVLVCTIFAIMVVGIIGAINRAYTYMGNIKLQVRATNFAREGVEMMYNIRDTNRRKYSGLKDEYWLGLGTGDASFAPGLYSLKEGKNGSDTYFYAVAEHHCADINQAYIHERPECLNFTSGSDYAITFTGMYYYASGTRNSYTDLWSIDNATGSVSELLTNDAEFYRVVRVYGIYKKDSDMNNDAITAENFLKDSSPKEMHFCVKVRYKGVDLHPHDVEICSIMTNFEE